MSTLVIHPTDRTTDCLKAVYSGIDATVINDTSNADELYELIKAADRTICVGHGLPGGLIGTGLRICVDKRHADLFKKQPDNVYVWCYATQFLKDNSLSGFATGMFISEMMEARILNVVAHNEDIEYGNDLFASIVGEGVRLGLSPEQIAVNVIEQYVGDNDVVRYNKPLLGSLWDGQFTVNEEIYNKQAKSNETIDIVAV